MHNPQNMQTEADWSADPLVLVSRWRFESIASAGAFILFNIVYLLPNLFIMAALQQGVKGKPHTTSESIKETHYLMDAQRCKYTVNLL